MSFINEIFNISLFLREGVKFDFENTKLASDVKAAKWKRTPKIRDQPCKNVCLLFDISKNHVCLHSTNNIIVHIGMLSVDRITSEISSILSADRS
jgi:hypothetical protein